MAKSKNTEAKPQAIPAEILDGINAELLAQGLAVRASQGKGEHELFQAFAKEILAGRMSTRGFSATVEAIEAEAGKFAEIRTSHASYLPLMAELSQVEGAPKSHSELYTLALGLIRHESESHGKDGRKVALGKAIQEKAKGARGSLATISKNSIRANKKADETKALNRASKEGKEVKSVKLDPATIDLLIKAIQGAKGELSEVMHNSLLTLNATIEAYLDLN
jgi:hypothetical protein